MNLSLNLPLNSVSFGQLSIGILREMYLRKLEPCLFAIGQPDISAQKEDADFNEWLSACMERATLDHKRTTPIFKLWHLNGSIESYSEKQVLLSFYELDSPTDVEINIAKNNHKLLFSSEETVDVFKYSSCDNVSYIPLGFDSHNFKDTGKKYFSDGRITFGIVGKFEKRKHHVNILKSWLEKYGDNRKYYLSASVYNSFFSAEDNNKVIAAAVEGKKYFNTQFLGFMQKNSMYNDYLNSLDVVVGMSGGEGWGLPEFQATALGKHSIIMNAHGYKGWANKDNSILVEPKGKVPAYDNMFFKEDSMFNQGNIYDMDAEKFGEACEEAIKRVEEDRVNKHGLTLQKDFTFSKMTDRILEELEL